VNELDLYVWDDPQADKPVTQSISSTQPLSATLFQPPHDKYQIVVVNSYGPNTAYHLKVTGVVDRVAPPVDAAKANKPAATAPPTTQPTPPAPAVSAASPPAPRVVAPLPISEPTAVLAPITADAELAGAATIDPLADDAEAVASRVRATRPKPPPPPKPASRVALIGWLVAVPLGLLIAERKLLFGRRLRGTVPMRG
jgi:hypothetical protein